MHKFKRGDQVAYVPDHANGDLKHSDVQFGFVTSGPARQKTFGPADAYFCRYWEKKAGGFILRNKSCSECTPVRLLVSYQAVSQELVDEALKAFC